MNIWYDITYIHMLCSLWTCIYAGTPPECWAHFDAVINVSCTHTRARSLLSDPRSLCEYSHNKKIYKQHTSNLWVSVCGCAYICMFVYIFVCVCMCICMYACMRVCVHVRAYVCVCIIICMCLEVCIIYLCRVKYAIQPCRQTRDRDGFGAVYTYINDVCVCVCVSVSVSVFLYIDR